MKHVRDFVIILSTLLIIVFSFFTSSSLFSQNDLLISAQNLCRDNKFKEAISILDKVVIDPETKTDPLALNLRAVAYLYYFKSITTYNSSKTKLLDTAMSSVLKSVKFDENESYKSSNMDLLKEGAEFYHKISIVLLRDSLNGAKSRAYFSNFRKYTIIYNPDFNFKEADIEYYNKRASCFLDYYLKNDTVKKYAEYTISSLNRVLELDSKNVLANSNLLVFRTHIKQLEDKEKERLIEFEKNKIENIYEKKSEKDEIEINLLNKNRIIYKEELKNQKIQNNLHKNEIEIISKEKDFFELEIEKNRSIMNLTIIVLFLLLFISIYIFINLQKNRKAKNLISSQNESLERQKLFIEQKQKQILESISYAKYLQEAILPPKSFLDQYIPQNFIIYKPKDIVAGDFYWSEKVGDIFFVAVADSTGHGVPGALVSIVCCNALNRAVKEFKLNKTGEVLDKTSALVVETFDKSTSEIKDGMDISLLAIDFVNKKICWSGANNPLWYITDSQLKVIKPNKQPIGKTDKIVPFVTHEIVYEANTTFYLFTDGFADQFGGENGKKFMYKKFSELLVRNNHLAIQQQAEVVLSVFDDWKGNQEQVDDVCVIGLKI